MLTGMADSSSYFYVLLTAKATNKLLQTCILVVLASVVILGRMSNITTVPPVSNADLIKNRRDQNTTSLKRLDNNYIVHDHLD